MPTVTNSQAIKEERNLQRLITKCKTRVDQGNIDTWSASDKSKFVQYIKYAQTMSDSIKKERGSISPQLISAIQELCSYIEQDSMNITIDKGVVQAQAGAASVIATISEVCHHEDEKQLQVQELEELADGKENISNEEKNDMVDQEEKTEYTASHSNDNLRELTPENVKEDEAMDEKAELRQRRPPPVSSRSSQPHEEETVQIEHVLQHHRQLQEELTTDLGRMAAQLKSNSLAFGDYLEKDDRILRDAQDAVASNLDRLRKEKVRLDRHNRKSWGTTFMTCGVFLFVSLMFVMVFFTIKFLPKAR
ncbi:hypothetical protein INT43_000057 [Umbelopsis isabellina]|uniref:Vesicle transport protein USE1 n=1 Tax=Mortierella isabellina TaxID=91625 RepID=A0A8H7PF15_MORIS|nr:hypothetical protein INT43_000057 [Umbelopsis isabellina]